ncbi:hypothetical protein [Lucifera butyrica]|nr:hypothetical protein [Lucifera butyrica]
MLIQSGICFAAQAPYGTLQAGAGETLIQIPPEFFPAQGFDGIHDPLYVKTLLLDNGVNKTAVVSIDMTSLGNVNQLKSIIQKTAGIQPDNIFIYAAHNFSSPHVFPGMTENAAENKKTAMFASALAKAVEAATQKAVTGMQPASIGYGTGISNVNINRDELTAGGWWHGSNETGYSDKELSVMKIDSLSGKPLAIFMNYSVQSSIMDESVSNQGKKLISTDLAGAATKYVEDQYKEDGTVAFFGVGAAGDQAPIFMANRYMTDNKGVSIRTDIHDDGYILLGLIGERLGYDAIKVSRKIIDKQTSVDLSVIHDSVVCKSQKMPMSKTADMKPVKQYTYQIDGEVKVPIDIMKIGNIALVGIQPELASKIGADIKKGSPVKNTMVLTMVNGAAKYMADKDSYDKFTYEARNSKYAKGSAELVENKIISMLTQLNSRSKASE